MEVPELTPVTRPELLMVATLVLLEIQDVTVPDPLSCVVPPIQVESVPVMAGKALTVNVEVDLHPLLLV